MCAAAESAEIRKMVSGETSPWADTDFVRMNTRCGESEIVKQKLFCTYEMRAYKLPILALRRYPT